jgi:hypothetical protein
MKYLTSNDIKQLQKKGLTEADIEQQLENFRQGFPYTRLVKAATPGDGIKILDHEELSKFKKVYGDSVYNNTIKKFIPASGAASRMFRFLFEYLEDGNVHNEDIEAFVNQIPHFAFYEDLKNSLSDKGKDINQLIERKKYKTIIRELLEPHGLNYGEFPKGLIKFHRYQNHSRTPVEEHMVEGVNYSMNADHTVRNHFTVLPEHKKKFESHIDTINPEYEKYFNVRFYTDYSFQKESTDRVAADKDNNLFRNQDGSLLFRPGGHGALLNNLNDLEDDLVFIKNIDNVVPDKYKPITYDYKKALAGILLDFQDTIFSYLRDLENSENLTREKLQEISIFLRRKLNVRPSQDLDAMTTEELASYLFQKLNRPVRVCGMVKNQGEPGGGPFWVKNSDNTVSLQIVEKSQIDMDDPDQKSILADSTHFNPVDLVCGLKDYKGEKFDLFQFRDPSAGIITHKSKGGKMLKVQELPGLWNGSMAFWNTLFVEVPLITFNPVKTINDLLRDEHQ